jgi:hypothetical protein
MEKRAALPPTRPLIWQANLELGSLKRLLAPKDPSREPNHPR